MNACINDEYNREIDRLDSISHARLFIRSFGPGEPRLHILILVPLRIYRSLSISQYCCSAAASSLSLLLPLILP